MIMDLLRRGMRLSWAPSEAAVRGVGSARLFHGQPMDFWFASFKCDIITRLSRLGTR